MDQLYQDLKKYGQVKNNVALAKFTTFQIGGPAKFFITIDDNQKLIDLLNYLSAAGVPYFVLGGGSNLLMPDEGFDGVVIKITTTKSELQKDNFIFAEAGVPLANLVNLAAKNELTGLEWGVGIPGTIGGAIRGNAGAMGREISACVKTVTIWQNSEITEMSNRECGFNYRESIFKDCSDVVLSTILELRPGNKTEIMQNMQGYIKQRTGRYPTFPSAGSFFKNIDLKDWPGDIKQLPELFVERKKIPVGWLIEQCDLKGYAIGGGKISDEHGNFVVNYKNATQEDILKIVEEASARVYNRFGITLEPEVEIIK